MTTQKQLAANRRNAQKSTGPKTPEGKHTSGQNARKHSLPADELVASSEDPAEFESLRCRLISDLRPEGALEELLVDQIAALHWRLRRTFRAEAGEIQAARDAALAGNADHQASGPTPERLARLRDAVCVARQEIASIGSLTLPTADRVTSILCGYGQSAPAITAFMRTSLPVMAARLAFAPAPAPLRESEQPPASTHEPPAKAPSSPTDEAPPMDPDTRATLLSALETDDQNLTAAIDEARQQRATETATLIARNSLPPTGPADKILRYDRTLTATLDRALNTLLRLQKARRPINNSPSPLEGCCPLQRRGFGVGG